MDDKIPNSSNIWWKPQKVANFAYVILKVTWVLPVSKVEQKILRRGVGKPKMKAIKPCERRLGSFLKIKNQFSKLYTQQWKGERQKTTFVLERTCSIEHVKGEPLHYSVFPSARLVPYTSLLVATPRAFSCVFGTTIPYISFGLIFKFNRTAPNRYRLLLSKR